MSDPILLDDVEYSDATICYNGMMQTVLTLQGCPSGMNQEFDGETIVIGTPIVLDENNDIVTSSSGKKFKMNSFSPWGNHNDESLFRQEVIKQIKEDIQRPGYIMY